MLARQFNTTSVLFARKERKIPIPTKKQLAAKARKRALKVRKHIYDSEKMRLQDAVAVLRVSTGDFVRCAVRYSRVPKAVEVARPNATLELVIKTAMPKGTTIPKGRLTWPREAKSQSEERVLVFAEGRQADEAKRAGAHVVGGLELVDDVGALLIVPQACILFLPRLSTGATTQPPSFVSRVSFVRSPRNSGGCLVQEVLCPQRGEGR